ncbi:Spy/CpxP family protein refolding chaperone [Hahella sp. HN01]|uniref:Spy/CpxP family protein refolding chaperone n=1 Tax=Hahella sp. HN01 TaxID=2847262 RepID=UPI001C1E904A|nr:Spy/CpxP family protein refolding chaperone [Hahella sp. HN01]MBU6953604.1 Spy/CpxP family protein refolding chaperone [Hahella sp. HN01]
MNHRHILAPLKPLTVALMLSLAASASGHGFFGSSASDSDCEDCAGGGQGMMRSGHMMGSGGMFTGDDWSASNWSGYGRHSMMGSDHRFGHGYMMGDGFMMGGMMDLSTPRMAGLLGLDDKQRNKIEEIQKQLGEQQWTHFHEMYKQHAAMQSLFNKDEMDDKAILEAHRAMADAHLKMLEIQLQARRKMQEVLTEEQRERVHQIQDYDWGAR